MLDNVSELHQMEVDEVEDLLSELGFDPTAEGQEVPQRFIVNDLDQLNWAFRKLEAYNAKMAAVVALAKSEQQRISDWLAKESNGLKHGIEFFERLVRDYAMRNRDADPKYKGEKTPYGAVSFTKSQPDWTYIDESATVAFLKADEALKEHVKVTEAIANKTDIKKALEIKRNAFVKDGEVVDIAESTVGGWIGMQYMERVVDIPAGAEWEKTSKHIQPGAVLTGGADTGGVLFEIVDMTTGEVADGVELKAAVAVANGAKVVPGLKITDKPDRINVNGAKDA